MEMRLTSISVASTRLKIQKLKMSWSTWRRCWFGETVRKILPDYYVTLARKDNDPHQAFNMIEYFKRNGVVIQELKEDVGNYKKATWLLIVAH